MQITWRGCTIACCPASGELPVELLVAAEDALLVEGNAPLAREIGLDVRPRRDAAMQGNEAGNLLLVRHHALRESVAQAVDDLEQREIDISQPPPRDVDAA